MTRTNNGIPDAQFPDKYKLPELVHPTTSVQFR